MKRFTLPLAAALALFSAGCSEQPAATSEQKTEVETPQPISGQSAAFKMFQVARSWAPDAQLLKLDSTHVADVAAEPGKSGPWEAVFTSAARSAARSYTWSAVELMPDLHKGVFGGGDQPYLGPSGPSVPFVMAALKVDTDAALKTAESKAADYEKKNPKMPITFLLEKTSRFPDPAWRVIWGESVSTSGFSVYVDATTGAYLETMH